MIYVFLNNTDDLILNERITSYWYRQQRDIKCQAFPKAPNVKLQRAAEPLGLALVGGRRWKESTGMYGQKGKVATSEHIIHNDPQGLLQATRSGAAGVKKNPVYSS